ncbi:testican-3-like [Talpa occidentalis]|uniref:testican-3-like n=1 Tax=Talpa occidentalis TaxID=50954 RepID=UPI0023F72D94|nr:testican-3-like [Talpa occidentalis]
MLKVSAVLCVCAAAWCSQALAAAAAGAAAGGRSDGGNFLDDQQWLTTISQYDKEAGQWNKFRDHKCLWDICKAENTPSQICQLIHRDFLYAFDFVS